MSKMSRYKHIKVKGNGGFGIVSVAIDSNNNTEVAVKEVNLKFNRTYLYKRMLREIDILQHLQSQYCIWLMDVDCNTENNRFDITLVMPLVQVDLRNLTATSFLRYTQIIKIMYQILMALKYLEEAGIIHRDLKPANIGINGNLDLKLLDFGLAREINGDMTEYVVTRCYRPIELFCGVNYSTAVDMWSAGCILAELLTRKILFKGISQQNQAAVIVKITGFPDEELLKRSHNENTFRGLMLYKSFAAESNQLEKHIRNDIENFILDEDNGDQECSDKAIQLICQMLDLDPSQRPTPNQALKAPLFEGHREYLNCYQDDPKAEKYSFSVDLNKETDESLQQMIIEKIANFKPRPTVPSI